MRIGSLFSGIGGLDLACEWAWPGASTAWQLDQVNAKIRGRHWPGALQVEADVTTVDPLSLPAVDVLCGGFPCQDLSVAGKQAGLDGERSGLYREVLRFTAAIRPRFVVCENVSGLLPYMPRLCEDFRALGYGLSWTVCEAADVGHPHLRKRVFVLAERGSSGRGLVEVDRRGRWTGEGEREWPTPRADEARTSGGRTGRDAAGESLTYAARPWATPRANPGGSGRRGGARSQEEMLDAQVRTWATPIATDCKTPAGFVRESGHPPSRIGEQLLPSEIGKRINPAWVECLMGYPPGWTEPTGPRLECRLDAPAVRGRYPASWNRSVPWPGYAWEPPRTIPDGPALPGRPARVKACGNAVQPQQGALALEALLADDGRQVKLW